MYTLSSIYVGIVSTMCAVGCSCHAFLHGDMHGKTHHLWIGEGTLASIFIHKWIVCQLCIHYMSFGSALGKSQTRVIRGTYV